jgi:hypothetical protein
VHEFVLTHGDVRKKVKIQFGGFENEVEAFVSEEVGTRAPSTCIWHSSFMFRCRNDSWRNRAGDFCLQEEGAYRLPSANLVRRRSFALMSQHMKSRSGTLETRTLRKGPPGWRAMPVQPPAKTRDQALCFVSLPLRCDPNLQGDAGAQVCRWRHW